MPDRQRPPRTHRVVGANTGRSNHSATSLKRQQGRSVRTCCGKRVEYSGRS